MRMWFEDNGIGYNPAYERSAKAKRAKLARQREIERLKAEEAAEKAAEAARLEAERRAQAHLEYRTIPVITDDRPNLRRLVEVIALEHGYTFADIVSISRIQRLVRVRQLAYRAAFDARPDMTLGQLALFFKKDRTTIMHGLSKVPSAKEAA